jgi:hypothetical protein
LNFALIQSDGIRNRNHRINLPAGIIPQS